uniref:Nucleolar protein 6 n=1 Tax=Cacopsylla melanoneura TaxID=428564 RepID=A0A8D8Y4Y0_9HEMI
MQIMALEEDIRGGEEDEEIPTLIPIGTKRKMQSKDAGSTDNSQEARKKLLKLTKKVKAPTVEELTRLRETENLFHSNMFRLQIEEMIKEVKPKEGKLKKAMKWCNSVATYIQNMESDETVYNLSDDSWSSKAGVRVPTMSKLRADPKTSFQFLKPAAVNVVGSVAAGCGFGPGLTVDLAVEMPKRLLHTGDHLNERYWRKKLAYLSVLASHLTTKQTRTRLSILSAEYRTTGDPGLYSVSLLVTPQPCVGSKIRLNIIAVPEAKGIKLSRCYPQACNIRSGWVHSNASSSDQSEEAESQVSTPLYNTLLARDVTVNENSAHVVSVFEMGGQSMREAYLLLCVWMKQRDLAQGCGTLSRFGLALYLCRLLINKKLNSAMSSYQMLRNVWVQLGSSCDDWTKSNPSNASGTPVTNETWSQYFPVVFLDCTGLYNVAATMSRDYYQLLKEEAQLALSCLDDINLDSFRLLFMTPAPFLRQFDHYICFNNREKLESVVVKHCTGSDSLDRGAVTVARFARLLVDFLISSLGERLSAVTWRTYPDQICTKLEEEYKEGGGGGEETSCLIVGIRLNTESCFKLIHRGPEANLPEAAAFRALWGSKAELRRFKDGTVCEASVWGSNTDPWRVRRVVTREMICYLLERQWGLAREDLVYLSEQLELEADLMHRSSDKVKSKPVTPGLGGEEITVATLQAWDNLARHLRDMNSLPLDIISVLPTAPVLRYTDPSPPLPCYQAQGEKLSPAFPVPPLVKPVEGVIEISASGKWPDDLDAIARLKAAFYIELSNRLNKEHKIVNRVSSHYMDVYQDGYVFRLRLYCAPEVTLLKKQIQDGVVKFKNTRESVSLQQDLVHLPLLHSALHGLHQVSPVLGPGLCLVKRWLGSQLLLDPTYWPEPCVELLGASLLTPTAPYPTSPVTPQTFFLRFLALLATHNFVTDPVVVNFNGELERKDILHIEARLRNDRGTLPALVLLTPWDPSAQIWSRNAPNIGTLVRTVRLARASLQLAESHLIRGLSCRPIFEFPRADFDVLISLNKSCVARPAQQQQSSVAQQGGKHIMPVVDFNPVTLFVQLLKETYGDMALFFYDVCDGLDIGVVIKPDPLLSDNKEMKFMGEL